MAFWTSTHGISNPLSTLYRAPLHMVFRPPTQGILNHVPMVYWTS
jgi:hypothetical protein